MRDLLTIFATFLVLALSAALVGPYLVDWSAHRAFVESALSRAVGAQVHVDGPIRLSLLPTPSLSVRDLSIRSGRSDGPSLTASTAEFELAIAPLAHGELQVLKAVLDRPLIRMTLRADGSTVLPGAPAGLPGQIDVEALRLNDATLVVERPHGAAALTLAHVDLDARAQSLSGPYSGSGLVRRGTKIYRFSFDSGTRGGGGLPLRAQAGGGGLPDLRLDGDLRLTRSAGGTRLTFSGGATAQGTEYFESASLPWIVSGPVAIDPAGVSLLKDAVRLGPQASAVSLQMTGRIGFGARSTAKLSLAARQADLDRLIASMKKTGSWGLQAAAAAARKFLSGAAPSLRLDASLSADSILVGGQTLAAMKAEVKTGPAARPRLDLRSQLPGRGEIAFSGSLETGPAAALRGRLALGAANVKRLATWFAPALPLVAARLDAAPFHALRFDGDVDLSAVAFESRDFALRADRTDLKGALAYTKAVGADPARLFADVTSDSLDLDSLPNLETAVSALRGADLNLSLSARAMRLARFGEGSVRSGSISLRLRKKGDRAALEQLSLEDVGGADVSLSGGLGPTGGTLHGTIAAKRLDELAAVLGQAFPGRFAAALAARAVALSPARLDIDLRAARTQDGRFLPTLWSVKGTVRGDALKTTVSPSGSGPAAVRLDLKGPDSSTLLRQIGLPTLPLADAGPGEVSLRGRLEPDDAFEGSVIASIAGTSMRFDGRAADVLGNAVASGRASLESPDINPLLRLSTIVLPDPFQALPAKVGAQIDISNEAIDVTRLAGAVAGDPVSGSLRLDPKAAPSGKAISGSLAFDRLNLSGLLSLALGRPSSRPGPNALWSTRKLGPGAPNPPSTALTLSAKSLDLGFGWVGRNAETRLDLSSDGLSLDSFDVKIGGGALTGTLDVHRNGATAAITGRLQARDVALRGPNLSGVASGDLSLAATGSTPMELIEGLAGGGSGEISASNLTKNSPRALPELLRQSEKEGFKVGSAAIQADLSRLLDQGPLTLSGERVGLRLVAGNLQASDARPVAIPSAGVAASRSISLDLRTGAASQRIELRSLSKPNGWPEATPPGFGIVWSSNGSGAPTRAIEAEELVGALATRAAAREAERISLVDQDMRERAFFLRRLKGLEFLHRREAEVAAWKARQAQAAKEAAAAQPARSETPDAAPSSPNPLRDLPPPAPPAPPAGLDPLSLGRF